MNRSKSLLFVVCLCAISCRQAPVPNSLLGKWYSEKNSSLEDSAMMIEFAANKLTINYRDGHPYRQVHMDYKIIHDSIIETSFEARQGKYIVRRFGNQLNLRTYPRPKKPTESIELIQTADFIRR